MSVLFVKAGERCLVFCVSEDGVILEERIPFYATRDIYLDMLAEYGASDHGQLRVIRERYTELGYSPDDCSTYKHPGHPEWFIVALTPWLR